jgi:MOSC domain-containing protein YiiM
MQSETGEIEAVHARDGHGVGKTAQATIRLLEGLGVEGDAHAGVTVKHRSRVARDPSQPNLRQVHLIHGELHDRLAAVGFAVGPGEMGENVTTRGIALLDLPTGTRLHLGPDAIVELTGLRNPCVQLDGIHPGLMAAVLDRDTDGNLVRLAGVMAIVLHGGNVSAGDVVRVEAPPLPHQPLLPV